MTRTLFVGGMLGMLLPIVSAAERVEPIIGSMQDHPPAPVVMPTVTDWPWWRGPTRDGIAPVGQDLPTEFGPNQHVVWKAAPPGLGHSSPILWGDQLYLTAADAAVQKSWLLAYDRANGQLRWQFELQNGGLEPKVHKANSHASATPACDGERVFVPIVHDGGLWLVAVSVTGTEQWRTRVGPYRSIYGFGSACCLHESLVIVAGDNDQVGAWLAAVHRVTGKIVWRIVRPDIDTYATPIVVAVAGKSQLVLGGPFTAGYDPATGAESWRCIGPTAETTANTIVNDAHTVYVSGGYPKPYTLMAVRADGAGDVEKTHKLWSVNKFMPYVPSPLLLPGRLFIMEDNGILSLLEPKTGKSVWTKRLGGDFSSSPVVMGDQLYVASEAGEVYVFGAGDRFVQHAKNRLDDRIMATPTIVGNRIYLRTDHALYAIGR